MLLLQNLLANVLELFAELSVTLRRTHMLSRASPLKIRLSRGNISLMPIVLIGMTIMSVVVIVGKVGRIALKVILILRLSMDVIEMMVLRHSSR